MNLLFTEIFCITSSLIDVMYFYSVVLLKKVVKHETFFGAKSVTEREALRGF